jgi:hypothetical protein
MQQKMIIEEVWSGDETVDILLIPSLFLYLAAEWADTEKERV